MKLEEYITGTGQRVFVHNRSMCKGRHCSIHNPSDHHMKDWPTNWRDDRKMMERICKCGVGHPDPDDLEHRKHALGHTSEKDLNTLGVHGCCGCCMPPHKK